MPFAFTKIAQPETVVENTQLELCERLLV